MSDDPDQPPFCKVAPEMGSHNLLRAVPVGQHQQAGNIAVLIYSLELYTTGFIAVVRMSWEGSGGMPPRQVWTAQDEHGVTYPYADQAGSGGGRPPDRFSWRLDIMFGAPVEATASRLDLSVTIPGSPSAGSTGERLHFTIPLNDRPPA